MLYAMDAGAREGLTKPVASVDAMQAHRILTMRTSWRYGTPPTDGNKYEMTRRVKNAGGYWITVVWATPGWWDGKTFVQHNQFTGGTRFVHAPNRWRHHSAGGVL